MTNSVPDIWRHDHDHDDEDQLFCSQSYSHYIEQPQQVPTPAKWPTETPVSETPHATPAKTNNLILPPKNFPSPTAPPTAPPTPTELETERTCFPGLVAQAQTDSPARAPAPSANAHPPASRPRYQNQTLTSALRATSKSPKARSRKRSVTFADQSDGDGEGAGRRERSLVRDRAMEIERRLGIADQEDEEAGMGSSVMSKGSEDGDLAGSEGGRDRGVEGDAERNGVEQ